MLTKVLLIRRFFFKIKFYLGNSFCNFNCKNCV